MGSLHGYEVVSPLPLRRLRARPGGRGRVSIEEGPASLLDRRGELTAWQERPGDGAGFALARAGGMLLAWCAVTGSYEIDARAQRIRASGPRFDEAWEHRIGTMALPLLLAERGELALHACAVVVDDWAMLFAGPSGRGKSTLALTVAELGHGVLSEDGVVIASEGGEPCARPGPRGARTAAVSRSAGSGRATVTATRRLVALPPGAEPERDEYRVGAVCVLAERGERLEHLALRPSRAIAALVPSLIHSGEPDALARSLALLSGLLERVPAYRVSMPDRLAAAPEASRSLLSDLRA